MTAFMRQAVTKEPESEAVTKTGETLVLQEEE